MCIGDLITETCADGQLYGRLDAHSVEDSWIRVRWDRFCDPTGKYPWIITVPYVRGYYISKYAYSCSPHVPTVKEYDQYVLLELTHSCLDV